MEARAQLVKRGRTKIPLVLAVATFVLKADTWTSWQVQFVSIVLSIHGRCTVKIISETAAASVVMKDPMALLSV